MGFGIGIGISHALSQGVGAPAGPLRVLALGQSNMDGMFNNGNSSSPPAAATGTFYWNGSALVSVPIPNGVRELANAIKAGVPSRNVYIGNSTQAGAASSYFTPGNTGYTNALAVIAGMGGVDVVLVQQGEGDADASQPDPVVKKNNFKINWLLCQSSLEAAVGHTIPFVIGGLATYGGATVSPGGTFDGSWQAIQDGCKELANENPRWFYSHSAMDIARTDSYHYSAAGYGTIGKRFAQSVLKRISLAATDPAWFISAATIVDATHTDVTVVHTGGTDFTPTSGITGFQVGNDNGATYGTPSAGVRQSATTARLTHSDLGTTRDRSIRYQYGVLPDVSGAVLDNSSLAEPLNLTAAQSIVAAGSGAYPRPIHIQTGRLANSTATQTLSGIKIDSSVAQLVMVIVDLAGGGVNFSSATLTPNGGSPITGTIQKASTISTAPRLWGLTFLVPAGTSGADNCTLTVTYASNPFSNSAAAIWSVPQSALSSTTPVDAQKTENSSSVSSIAVNVATSAHGFYVALAGQANGTSNSGAWTGTETIVERYDVSFGFEALSGDAYDNAANAASTVTATFANSASCTVLAMSFR